MVGIIVLLILILFLSLEYICSQKEILANAYHIRKTKQVNLLIQAFKQNGFKEINNLFNMKYIFIIVFFMILIAIKLMRY